MNKRNNTQFIILTLCFLCLCITRIEAQNEKEIPTSIPNKDKIEYKVDDQANQQFISGPILLKPALYSDPIYAYAFQGIYIMPKFRSALLNYSNKETHKLSSNFAFSFYNKQMTYPILNNYNTVGTSIRWSPFNNLSIEGGGFLSKQYGHILFSRHITYGYNWILNYDITNRLQFSIFGQYIINSNNDPFMNLNKEVPRTSMGAALQYKANENTKIGVGVEYQYNQFDRKWESDSKVFIGF